MRLLLDTHLLLWAAEWNGMATHPLPAAAVGLIRDPANEPIFSVASLWEISIKHALRRPDFTIDPRRLRLALLDNGYIELPLLAEHALATVALPHLHRDPFDRMLVAQATVEGITLLTADAVIASYPGPILKV